MTFPPKFFGYKERHFCKAIIWKTCSKTVLIRLSILIFLTTTYNPSVNVFNFSHIQKYNKYGHSKWI